MRTHGRWLAPSERRQCRIQAIEAGRCGLGPTAAADSDSWRRASITEPGRRYQHDDSGQPAWRAHVEALGRHLGDCWTNVAFGAALAVFQDSTALDKLLGAKQKDVARTGPQGGEEVAGGTEHQQRSNHKGPSFFDPSAAPCHLIVVAREISSAVLVEPIVGHELSKRRHDLWPAKRITALTNNGQRGIHTTQHTPGPALWPVVFPPRLHMQMHCLHGGRSARQKGPPRLPVFVCVSLGSADVRSTSCECVASFALHETHSCNWKPQSATHKFLQLLHRTQ